MPSVHAGLYGLFALSESGPPMSCSAPLCDGLPLFSLI